jgi:hypothetical protein
MKPHRDCGLHLTATAGDKPGTLTYILTTVKGHVIKDDTNRVTQALQAVSYVLDDRRIWVLLPTGVQIILLAITL